MLKQFVTVAVIATAITVGKVCAQQRTWPPKEWNDTLVLQSCYRGRPCYLYHPNFRSVLILQNGDTVNGNLRFIWGWNGFQILKVNEFASHGIRFKHIKWVKIYTGISDSISYERYNIGHHNRMVRKIGEKNEVRIYDECYWGDHPAIEPFIPPLLLVVKPGFKPIKICGELFPFIWNLRYEKPILKFINKRYHVELTMRDLKTEQEMIDYILNAENERLKARSAQ